MAEKNYLFNIKNIYKIKQIFCYLDKRKALQIIRYNKKIQIKLNLELKDYKKFFEEYNKIIIEIIPKEELYGSYTIINISDKYKDYYHIYFNDDYKTEIKKNTLRQEYNTKKINIIIDYQIKTFSELFKNLVYINKINFIKF